MGIMVYTLFWVMQDFYHQPYECLGSDPLGLGELLSRDLAGARRNKARHCGFKASFGGFRDVPPKPYC